MKKAGLTYVLKQTATKLKAGIGVSKREIYLRNNRKSPYIHSYSTFNRYMGVAKDFVRWCKERNVNRLHQVKYEHVKAFLQEKISRNLSHRTIKVNASALKKFFEASGRNDLVTRIEKDYQNFYSQARIGGRAMGYANPQRVIQALRKEENKLVAELQLLTGARVGEVKKIRVNPDSQTVHIKGKGGREREISFKDRKETFSRIQELKEKLDKVLEQKSWSTIRKNYYMDLNNACKKVGEHYAGSHAFRVNYVKNRIEELVSNGYTLKEAYRIVEGEIGHNRIEQTIHYSRG